jgi:hypothetical protein
MVSTQLEARRNSTPVPAAPLESTRIRYPQKARCNSRTELVGETRSLRGVSTHVEEVPSAECPIGPGFDAPLTAQRGAAKSASFRSASVFRASSNELARLSFKASRTVNFSCLRDALRVAHSDRILAPCSSVTRSKSRLASERIERSRKIRMTHAPHEAGLSASRGPSGVPERSEGPLLPLPGAGGEAWCGLRVSPTSKPASAP